MPFTFGDKLPPKTTFTWSDNIGMLRTFKAGSSATFPNKGVITLPSTAITLNKNYLQEMLLWNF